MRRAKERQQVISLMGVPKTIDNDIPLIDFSFGFHTSVEVAATMINAAYVEATSVINGVGLVKLMGRYSGFIAMQASLANNSVDFCLVPELPFELGGERGLYEQVLKRVQQKGHCLIVVAEGAEEGLINPNEKITLVEKKDASGNLQYDDVGDFLEKALADFALSKNVVFSVSYIDPTYSIRSVASNPADTLLCTTLA
jgi:6-phosphofructokinase 1